MAPCYSPGTSRAQGKGKSWWEERFLQTCDSVEGPTSVRFPKQVVEDTHKGFCEGPGVSGSQLKVEVQQGRDLQGTLGFEYGSLAVGGTPSPG